jgi:Mg-chelatase subunit ChlD
VADLLITLRERLDRLAADAPSPPRLSDRLARLAGLQPRPEPRELLELDRGLDRAGIFTLADARLLARLMREGARAGQAGRGIEERTKRAARELSRVVTHEERRKRLEGPPSFSAVARLEDLFARLTRAMKVVEVLVEPDVRRTHLFELLPGGRAPATPPGDARLAAAEFLVGRARGSVLDVRKKRRDLDAAHELLLRIGCEGDRERARALRAEVTAERASPLHDRVSASGDSRLAALVRASQEGRGADVWSASIGLFRDAVTAGDASLASASRRVLESLSPAVSAGLPAAIDAERARAFLLDVGPEGAVAEYLRSAYSLPPAAPTPGARDGLAELALDLDSAKWVAFDLSVGAGRFFDVEEATAEDTPDAEPVAAPAAVLRRVPYPTPLMSLDLARGLEELPGFLLTDPRMILYDLASNRQLARAYLAPDCPREPPRKTRRGAVRVYVCDASASMRGERARFRDALLIAELNNLSVREARGLARQPVYYSFFTDHATDVARVNSSAGALKVVAALFERSPAQGRTDITFALESAYGAIRDARGHDQDLGRATVVLVTDGEDRVDPERLRAAQAPFGELDITLNFLSLGCENRDLKELVLEQREKGRRAFYYHLTDAEIAGLRGDFDCTVRTLLPARPELALKGDDPEVKAAIDALVALARVRSDGTPIEGSPASRFEAFFPEEPRGDGVPSRMPCGPEILADLLAAVCEAAGLAPAETRADEAVRLLEHLLSVYGVRIPAYLRALPALDGRARESIERIRTMCTPIESGGGPSWV